MIGALATVVVISLVCLLYGFAMLVACDWLAHLTWWYRIPKKRRDLINECIAEIREKQK